MNTQQISKIMLALSLVMLLTACGAPAKSMVAKQASITDESIANTIAKFEEEIPGHMLRDNIPGLAIAVVDDQRVLWEEGFGYTDWDRQTPVTPSTLFSIQSMSKSFTATAVMIAAQEGLVDLDEPITTYLPDFTVHSIFEEHPERKMTLRILLSHTAGFPHDASYGNNNDFPADYSFEKHIASIPDTWLMFPVGTRYSYSNEDIDLAGYILQVRSGKPFIQYIQEKILDPLGMKDSTLDINRVRANSTRAIGHLTGDFLRPRVDFLIIPSGGVWTSAEDIARYLQFHINKGALDGKRLLEEDLAETMYTPPNPPALGTYQNTGYALGIEVSTRNQTRILYHGGGGFGFDCHIAWYPELKLGSVVLSNQISPDGYQFNLGLDVLDDILTNNAPFYRQRIKDATQTTPAYLPESQGMVLTDEALKNLIAGKALVEDAAAQKRWNTYAGTYYISTGETLDIGSSDGRLTWTYHGQESMWLKNSVLTEVAPGLLMSENGNVLDLRGPILMMDNLRLVKVSPQAMVWRNALYAVCGLTFVSVLLFWPARAVQRRVRRKKTPAAETQMVPQRSAWLVGLSILGALASLFSLFFLALFAFRPSLMYSPGLRPYVDLTWWQFVLLGMPLISLAVAVMIALVSGLAIRSRALRWYFLAVGLALIAFNVTLVL